MTVCNRSNNSISQMLLLHIVLASRQGQGKRRYIFPLYRINRGLFIDRPDFNYAKIYRVLQNLLLTGYVLCLLLLTQSSCVLSAGNQTPSVDNCPAGATVESEDGIRRLALIVGVGQYRNPNIPNLPGPPQDAMRIYKLLTGPNGYGFPKQNVCVLLDAEATTANFNHFFGKALIDRARADDEVVIYYAGHGSQTKDKNGDEQDGMDETFVFHDARNEGVKDFPDDGFDSLLTTLYKKTRHITVILDSCNSGTAVRGDLDYLSRYVPPEDGAAEVRGPSPDAAEQQESTGWVSQSLPGVVFFTAAGDGTSALEKNARGIFTDALLTTLGQVNAKQLTYAQAARQIRPLVKAESYQIPYFQGDLQRLVLSGIKRDQPLAWEIVTVEPQITLGGFPLPGIGRGAEFRVYAGSVSGADTQDPAKAKAVVVVDESTGLNAVAHLSTRTSNAPPIKPGDLAVLSRPGDQQRLLKLTLRPNSAPGGIAAENRKALADVLKRHPDAGSMIRVVADHGDFELSREPGQYVIRGPENRERGRFKNEIEVIENLRLHAIQRVLSSLRGEGGSQFIDQETLQVQIVPAQNQDPCARDAQWRQQPPNAVKAQQIPLCYKWHVKVRLSKKSPVRLLIGGLILSTDGSIFGFPADGSMAPLGPGEEIVFAAQGETFVGSPPLHIEDQIIVFGTQESNPVPWSRLTQSSGQRSTAAKSGLYRALDRYLSGTRGVVRPVETADADSAWTLSSITMRVTDRK